MEHFCPFCNTDSVLHSGVINCLLSLPTISYLWVGEAAPYLTQHNEGWLKMGGISLLIGLYLYVL